MELLLYPARLLAADSLSRSQVGSLYSVGMDTTRCHGGRFHHARESRMASAEWPHQAQSPPWKEKQKSGAIVKVLNANSERREARSYNIHEDSFFSLSPPLLFRSLRSERVKVMLELLEHHYVLERFRLMGQRGRLRSWDTTVTAAECVVVLVLQSRTDLYQITSDPLSRGTATGQMESQFHGTVCPYQSILQESNSVTTVYCSRPTSAQTDFETFQRMRRVRTSEFVLDGVNHLVIVFG